jgi:hypothetical protein
MARDKINNICIKPTIATLIQRYNTAIISSWTAIRFSWKQSEPYMTVFTFHSYIYRKRKNIRRVAISPEYQGSKIGSKNSNRKHNISKNFRPNWFATKTCQPLTFGLPNPCQNFYLIFACQILVMANFGRKPIRPFSLIHYIYRYIQFGRVYDCTRSET